jgi:FtsH-binding integral membrane protein
MWVFIIAPLALVFLLSFRIGKMSVGAAQATFWGYAVLLGISLSSIFLVYTMGSITQVFFITAAMFGTMSLWGYTTKRDLTAMGSFLMMGVIGIVIAMVVNLFLASAALGFAISIIGVIAFTGLTAFDTQKIKEFYSVNDDGTVSGRKAIMGALALYLDFVNLFLFLLRILGDRR